jgi:hypothetical protein
MAIAIYENRKGIKQGHIYLDENGNEVTRFERMQADAKTATTEELARWTNKAAEQIEKYENKKSITAQERLLKAQQAYMAYGEELANR